MIETLMVMIVIIILSLVLILTYQHVAFRAKVESEKSFFTRFVAAVTTYKTSYSPTLNSFDFEILCKMDSSLVCSPVKNPIKIYSDLGTEFNLKKGTDQIIAEKLTSCPAYTEKAILALADLFEKVIAEKGICEVRFK